jgi:hypothetical protein
LIVALTFHAMVNLALRLQARTLDDLLAGLRQLWEALEPRIAALKRAREPFLVPIGDGGSPVIEWDPQMRTYICKTVLGPDMTLPSLPIVTSENGRAP